MVLSKGNLKVGFGKGPGTQGGAREFLTVRKSSLWPLRGVSKISRCE